ncbi:hypothetical protein MMC24_007966, partial [Lignoscripta atroalba]|nr:hypothetical protein [Lignoscripta atroalba]
MVLRYEKLTDKQISELVRDVINDDDVDEQSYYYRKECVKVRTNIFTWKNRTLSCMKDYVKAVIEKDSLSLLKTETDSAKLFRAFQQ